MCLAVPARVVTLEGGVATVEVGGNTRQADVTLLDEVKVGDYVLLHAGFAIGRYDRDEALETLRALEDLARAMEPPSGDADGDKSVQ